VALLCRLVEEVPLLLEVECVRASLSELARLMPRVDGVRLLRDDPTWLLRLQSGQKWLGQHPD